MINHSFCFYSRLPLFCIFVEVKLSFPIINLFHIALSALSFLDPIKIYETHFRKWTNTLARTYTQHNWNRMFDCAKGFCIIFEYRRLLLMILWLFVCDFFGIGCIHTEPKIPQCGHLFFFFIRGNSILVFTTSFPYLFCLYS